VRHALPIRAPLTPILTGICVPVRVGKEGDVLPENDAFWGAEQQLRFGLIVVTSLHITQKTPRLLDPVFGSLLAPAGGIVRPVSCTYCYYQAPC
jgi:hypothetical protein